MHLHHRTCFHSAVLFFLVISLASADAADEPAPAATPPAEVSRQLTERLQSNMSQLESQDTSHILLVLAGEDDSARVFGLVTSEDQRKEIEEMGLKALQREADQGLLNIRLDKLDASPMVRVLRPVRFPVDAILQLERALSTLPRSLLRVQRFSSETATMELCGAVDDPPHLDIVCQTLPKAGWIKDVESACVVVTSERSSPGEYAWDFADIYDAMRSCDGPGMVAVTTSLIRRGHGTAAIWYLRAAGHLIAGQKREAAGDVRIATALDYGSYHRSRRFWTLSRFQGTQREELERMVASGVMICLRPMH